MIVLTYFPPFFLISFRPCRCFDYAPTIPICQSCFQRSYVQPELPGVGVSSLVIYHFHDNWEGLGGIGVRISSTME